MEPAVPLEVAPPEPFSRADIALRNRRRNLQEREFKLLRLISGIHAYTAISCVTIALKLVSMGAQAAALAGFVLALAVVCGYVFISIWRSKPPPTWLVLLPSSIFILLGFYLGAFMSLVFWLNIVAHAAAPFLFRVQSQISQLPSTSFNATVVSRDDLRAPRAER
jgi:hypothetical protein